MYCSTIVFIHSAAPFMLGWKAELGPWVDPTDFRNSLQNLAVNWTPYSDITGYQCMGHSMQPINLLDEHFSSLKEKMGSRTDINLCSGKEAVSSLHFYFTGFSIPNQWWNGTLCPITPDSILYIHCYNWKKSEDLMSVTMHCLYHLTNSLETQKNSCI